MAAIKIDVKDVFISYRREDGATAARLLCDAFERRDISTFFDKTELKNGSFSEAIETHIVAARNFILVVSPQLFSRGINEDGTYDENKIKNDNVCKEIIFAINADRNIIPVFVNGMKSFPTLIPAVIEKRYLERQEEKRKEKQIEQTPQETQKDEFRKLNGLALNHDDFDSRMSQLISWLITPKHLLLNAYLEIDKKYYDGSIDSLLRLSKSLSNDKGKVIENTLKKLIRNNWEQGALPDEEVIDELLSGNSLTSIKAICKKLKLDDTGALRRLKANLLSWIKNETVREYNKSKSNNDRLIQLIDACGEVFKSIGDRQQLIKNVESYFENQIDLTGKKSSSWYVFDAVLRDGSGIDVDNFFMRMKHTFQPQEIKNICKKLSIDSQASKDELIDGIVDFVNYEYYETDITQEDE